jgi:predicted DCC family thiol-disulfide oxidoreductase YuxK
MNYNVIYDGTCNLCVTLVQLLENLDQGQRFEYIPMQDLEQLNRFGITSETAKWG